jgi:hypothetical protein
MNLYDQEHQNYATGIFVYLYTRILRPQTYNFTIEGGNDPARPSKYHPFYVTDSPSGGFQQKQKWERAQERVFAGVRFDAEGNPTPTARQSLLIIMQNCIYSWFCFLLKDHLNFASKFEFFLT